MKKIAILSCVDSVIKCSNVDCFGFFENRERSFSMYGDRDVSVGACIICDCCKHEDDFDSFMDAKILRLKKYNISDVHVTDCVTSEKKNCQFAKKVLDKLRKSGLNIYFIKPSSKTENM